MWDELHVRCDSYPLHCYDIWYFEDLPWKIQDAMNSNCLTSVVQSSSGASVNGLYSELYLQYSRNRRVEIIEL